MHRFQVETPKAGLWGANARRVSQGHFQVVGCRAFRLAFEEGLGDETEEVALVVPIMRQVFAQPQESGGRQGEAAAGLQVLAHAMTDALFLRLNERFALGADDLQWILYKSRREDAPAPNAPLEVRDWFPISFVHSTKGILLRCMREKGCFPWIEAQAAIEAMPSTFNAWKAATTCRKAILEPVAD